MTDKNLVTREEEPRNPFRKEGDPTSHTAMAEVASSREVAQVQAALVMARKFPRDQVKAMDEILQDCTLPALAEAATFDYVRGGTQITGETIRLAEAVARRWGNIQCGVMELSRHDGYSECKAFAWDLETGYWEEKTFQVRHWRDTRQGGYQLTDERDIYELVANMGARRKRACILSVIPLDVFDRAKRMCEVTVKNKVNVTDDLLAEVLERFQKYSVTKELIEKRIQRRFAKESVTPGMILQLKKIFNSLEDGMSVPADWFKPDLEATLHGQQEERTPSGRKKPKAKEAPKSDAKPPAEPPAGGEPEAVTKLADASQLEFIRNKAKAGEIGEHEVCKAFKLEKLEQLRAAVVPAVMKWLSDPTSAPGA